MNSHVRGSKHSKITIKRVYRKHKLKNTDYYGRIQETKGQKINRKEMDYENRGNNYLYGQEKERPEGK
jgi:hypothetical protein